MSRIKCFFIEPTNEVARSLRRYARGGDGNPGTCPNMPGKYSIHDASVPVESATVDVAGNRIDGLDNDRKLFAGDPRWPKKCSCGYIFKDTDERQVFQTTIYARVDTGEKMTLRNAPPGAMWFADWLIHGEKSPYMGPDGHCLAVKTPGGEWTVDGRASNCGLPNDNVHKCWCRHGDPRSGDVTVDKNGNTCNAGAGSIQAGNYHGFLRGGFLESC